MHRFLIAIPFALVSFSAAAEEGAVIEEYQNVPPGLLLPRSAAAPAAPADASAPASDNGVVMTIEETMAAYKAGKYALVFPRIRALAEKGNAQAEETLGVMYHNGQGVEKNPAEALKWLTLAADAARPLAQHHLAVMHYMGEGVPQNTTTALVWLQLAILYYSEGPEKKRAQQDRDHIYLQVTRRDKDRAKELAREWLDKRGDGLLLDLQ